MFLPLTVTIKPSRIFLLILALLHGLAAWSVTLSALPEPTRWGLLFLIALSLARQGWLHLHFPAGRSIRALSVDSKNVLWLLRAGEEAQPAQLKSAWLGPGLGVASVRSGDRTHRVMWLPDSAGPQELRRWRVWLRWHNQE